MKLNFLELSRRTKKRIKIYLLIFSLAAGFLTAAESRYGMFRLLNIEAEPQGIIPQHVVLGTVTQKQERCWLLLWISKKSYCDLIEKYYPVNLRIGISGWGKFRLEVMPLDTAFKMYWAGKFWFVAPNGKVWLTSMEESRFVPTAKVNLLPVLSWSSDKITPIDISGKAGNVYNSSLPMDRILKWYENINALGWSRKIKFIQAGKREDKAVVRLIFYDQSGNNGVNVMFADDPAAWQTTGMALKKIYPDLTKVSSDVFIDTTYKGKILVKNKVQ